MAVFSFCSRPPGPCWWRGGARKAARRLSPPHSLSVSESRKKPLNQRAARRATPGRSRPASRPSRAGVPPRAIETRPLSDEIDPPAKSAASFLRRTAGRSNGKGYLRSWRAWLCRCRGRRDVWQRIFTLRQRRAPCSTSHRRAAPNKAGLESGGFRRAGLSLAVRTVHPATGQDA